jgi:hypothetical protein
MDKYTIKTSKDRTYELFRSGHWFKSDTWLMSYKGAPVFVGGVRKKDRFIPSRKIRSRLKHFIGYQVVFAENTGGKPKEIPEQFWHTALCGHTSEIKEVSGPEKAE